MVDLVERVNVLVKQECERYTCEDYLSPSFQSKLAQDSKPLLQSPLVTSVQLAAASHGNSSSSSSGINEVWREKICEWSYQVVDHFDFSREVVAISITILDMFLSKQVVDKKIFQLAAMTSLYLAIKLNERGTLSMKSMIELSRGYFMPEQMRVMEMSILQTLSWHVHPPTPFCFVRHFAYLFPQTSCTSTQKHDLLELARFLTELSIIDYYFVDRRPSHIACAALLNAMDMTTHIDYHAHCDFLSNFKYFDGLDPACQEVNECRSRLLDLYNAGGYVHTPLGDAPSDGRTETISPVSVNAFDAFSRHHPSGPATPCGGKRSLPSSSHFVEDQVVPFGS